MKKIILSAGVLILLSLMCACSFLKKSTSASRNILQPWTEDASFSGGSWRDYTFTDTAGTEYKAAATPSYPACPFDLDNFVLDNGRMTYEDDHFRSRLGVDVSYYQGDIDWHKVRDAGYSFAFIRIGYRGYSSEGGIYKDDQFLDNIRGAQAAGLDTGVYFFSQALSDKEAVEEARFVIQTLRSEDITLQLPVVFDPEVVFETGSRSMTAQESQFTSSCLAFCREIAEGGYDTAIYASMMWEAFTLDMASLSDYPIWYADYVSRPQTPYSFTWWQYSCKARVDGIDTVCDVNIQMLPKE